MKSFLRSDAECRTFYLRYVDLHARLMQHPGFRPAAPVRERARCPDDPPPASPVLGFLGDLGRQAWGFASDHTAFFSVLAALILVAGLVAITVHKGRDEGRNPDGTSEVAVHQSEISNPDRVPSGWFPAPAPVARLTGTAECNWGQAVAAPELGTAFAAGQKISFSSGAIELVFDVGVRAVVQGPAHLDLVAPGRVFLHAGKMSSEIMRPEARGFEVQTPKGSVVDLGTEFGVAVTPSEDVQVHVFKGEVVVEQPLEAAAGQHVRVDQGLRIEGGLPTPWLVKDSGETFIRTIADAQRDRHVVAYWRFEDQPLGVKLPGTSHNSKPVRATVDSSFNGNDLYAYSAKARPTFSPDVPADTIPQTGSPNRSCLDTLWPAAGKGQRNVYTHSEFSHAAPLDIQTITPAQWTVEASLNAARLSGEAQTFVGRDTCFTLAFRGDPPRLAFKIDAQRRFAIAFFDAEDRRHEALAEEPLVEANRWYHVAATSDGRTLRLYVDTLDGRGYQLRAAQELPAQGSTALGKGEDNAEWSVGRGRDGINPGEVFQGLIDEVRISDVALKPSDFLFSPKGQGEN